MKINFYRIYEIIPGLLVWVTLLGAIFLSFFKPIWAVYFIIVFDIYWLFRVSYFVFYVSVSWRHFKKSLTANWLAEIKKISNWDEMYHLIFLPVSKEDASILRATFSGIEKAAFNKSKFLIVLAGEERNLDTFLPAAEVIKKEFASQFGRLWITIHPQNLPNEIPGKGSNLNYAGHQIKKLIDEEGIPYEKIIVSTFDADTIVHPQYFTHLTYKFLTVYNPLRASYQPITLYNNNMWEASAPVRVAALGTTFWLMTELPRSERLFTFSSHSMPFQALVDVGFWQKDIVSEDSRIFLQCFMKYNGEYRVEPLYIPVSMDAVSGENYLHGLKNLYKQQRRWAWGVENFPYISSHFAKNKLISLKKKIKYLWNQGEGMYSWATAPLLILLLGRLPFLVPGSSANNLLLFQNAPNMLQWLMRLAMLGLFVSAILTAFLLPPRPKAVAPYKNLFMFIQWALLPLTLIIFGSIPAIDAQTRLMLGRYLGFNVTEKKRKSSAVALLTSER